MTAGSPPLLVAGHAARRSQDSVVDGDVLAAGHATASMQDFDYDIER